MAGLNLLHVFFKVFFVTFLGGLILIVLAVIVQVLKEGMGTKGPTLTTAEQHTGIQAAATPKDLWRLATRVEEPEDHEH